MPSSAKDRFTVDFEYVYFFVKSKKYWFEPQYENVTGNAHPRGDGVNPKAKIGTGVGWGNQRDSAPNDNRRDRGKRIKQNPSFSAAVRGLVLGRNKRCVWTIPTQPFPEAHFATYPEKLVEPMIKAGCPEFICCQCGVAREKVWETKTEYCSGSGKAGNVPNGKYAGSEQALSGSYDIRMGPNIEKTHTGYTDCGCGAEFEPGVVWDPFVGSGTTLQVAARLGMNYGGSELKLEYIKMAERRIMVGETGISVKEQNWGQGALFK
jgi:hypothetical protein